MNSLDSSRRSFLKSSLAVVGTTHLMDGLPHAQSEEAAGPLLAYVGTFSSPLNDVYCCNQRGDNIAVFQVDRKTGGLNFTGHYSPVGNPSIVVFLDLAEAG